MEDVIFLSTHCPKCKVLEAKLKQKNINYTEINDTDEMIKLGIQFAPALKVGDEIMDFVKAVEWVNSR